MAKKTTEQKQINQINENNKLEEGLFSPFLKKLYNRKVERAMKKATSDSHFKHLIKKFNRSLQDLEDEFEQSAKMFDREVELAGGKKEWEHGQSRQQKNYLAAMKALYPDVMKHYKG